MPSSPSKVPQKPALASSWKNSGGGTIPNGCRFHLNLRKGVPNLVRSAGFVQLNKPKPRSNVTFWENLLLSLIQSAKLKGPPLTITRNFRQYLFSMCVLILYPTRLLFAAKTRWWIVPPGKNPSTPSRNIYKQSFLKACPNWVFRPRQIWFPCKPWIAF